MAKSTASKLGRMFEEIKSKNPKTGLVSISVVRRKEPLPATERMKAQCGICGGDIYVSPGQHTYGHKQCRKDARSRKVKFVNK